MSFSLVDVRKPSFHKFLCGPLSSVIGMRTFASRTIFRIYWRLSPKYLATKDTTKGIRLRAELEVEGPRVEGFSSSSISISMEERAQDIGTMEGIVLRATKSATKA